MPLTNEEQETIISFDETPAEAVIFTYSKKWQKHLEQKLGLKPTMNNGHGGKEYHIAKSRIPLPRVPRKVSPEERERLTKQLGKARHQKSPNPLGNNTAIKESQGKSFNRTKTTCRSGKAQKNKQKIEP